MRHICSPRCLRRIGSSGSDQDFVYRKINNFESSPDDTRSCVIPLGNKRSPHVVEILRKIKSFEPILINEFGCISLLLKVNILIFIRADIFLLPMVLTTSTCRLLRPNCSQLADLCKI